MLNQDKAFDMKSMIMSFLPMGVIFGLQALKLDYTDPNIILLFRAVYGGSLVIFLAVCGLIYMNIQKNAKALEAKLRYADKRSASEMMTLKNEYEALPADKRGEEPQELYMVEETVAEHDLKHLKANVMRTLQGSLITIGIHWYWGFMPPLIIQGVLSVIRLFDQQLVQIHLLGNTTIKRPFREEPGFLSKLSGEDPNAKLEAFERAQNQITKKKTK